MYLLILVYFFLIDALQKTYPRLPGLLHYLVTFFPFEQRALKVFIASTARFFTPAYFFVMNHLQETEPHVTIHKCIRLANFSAQNALEPVKNSI